MSELTLQRSRTEHLHRFKRPLQLYPILTRNIKNSTPALIVRQEQQNNDLQAHKRKESIKKQQTAIKNKLRLTYVIIDLS